MLRLFFGGLFVMALAGCGGGGGASGGGPAFVRPDTTPRALGIRAVPGYQVQVTQVGPAVECVQEPDPAHMFWLAYNVQVVSAADGSADPAALGVHGQAGCRQRARFDSISSQDRLGCTKLAASYSSSWQRPPARPMPAPASKPTGAWMAAPLLSSS